MRIKAVRVEEAVGKVLAYDVTSSSPRFKGALMRRGRVIGPEDVQLLKDNGHYYVYVYEEGEQGDEVHEDEAVAYLAERLAGDNVRVRKSEEGKALLVSSSRGLLVVNVDLLNVVNGRGVFMVITRRHGSLVSQGDVVGIVDLIPFTVSRGLLEELAETCTKSGPIVSVRELKPTRIALVVTGTEIYEGRKQDLAEGVVRQRESRYSFELTQKIVVPDEPELIKSAVLSAAASADAVIVTGGMSVDPNDYTPRVIASISDEVVAYGIPFKPNTMTMVAYLQGKPIIGVSGGIVHYTEFNILDVLLPWVASRTKITRDFLLSLANGGLTDYFLSKSSPRLSSF